ncbi:hypothetical protein [Hymenobacter sp.]|uniref:hypothetical protein n=1 Tax=Hymenobacter sp. TaxID=1898978 RepID=UPI00286CB6FD|nr:hypothetical protein [Hymenobacter sp.]
MNFLFTTVLVLLLVAPGLSFFRFYHAGRFSIRYSNLTVTDQVFRSIVPGLLLQAAMFWLINRWHPGGHTVRLDLLGTLLLGAKEDKTIQLGFSTLQANLGATILYEVGLLALGALAGWASRHVVRRYKWDRRFRWFRYDNEWHYLLTGEILETSDILPIIRLQEAKHIDFVVVDALVKLENGDMLYSGFLAGYELAADGGLRTIYIHSAQRKQLTTAAEDATMESYYPVDGDLLTLPYEQLLNLNISYFIDEQDAKTEGDEALAIGGTSPQITLTGADESGAGEKA